MRVEWLSGERKAGRVLSRRMNTSQRQWTPRAGDRVEVRSRQEILRTLDQNGQLGGMPFMPQMFQFCGRQFHVSRRAHKSCDTVNGPGGLRLTNTVHLEDLRCDGAPYGGCEAGCLLFWRTEWLKPLDDGLPQPQPRRQLQPVCTEEDVWRSTRAPVQTDPDDPVYVCQATRLPHAARPLPWWDLRQYIEDYTSGNVPLGRLLAGAIYACYAGVASAGIGLGRPMAWVYDKLHVLWRGAPFPRRTGSIPSGNPTPARSLNLRPGDLVRVRPYQEILATLNVESRNRGLYFDAEAVPYCGGTYRVARRLTRIVNEKTGRLLRFKNDSVVLEGVTCQARYSTCRMFCPRGIESYWREIWLERVADQPVAMIDSQCRTGTKKVAEPLSQEQERYSA
jgi:hypothetical protein